MTHTQHHPMKKSLPFATAFLLAAAGAVAAETPPAVTFDGYVVVTGSVQDTAGAATDSALDVTHAKFGIKAQLAPTVTAYASMFYRSAFDKADLLDAYVAYEPDAGLKITVGNFLSYLGYEAFDPINLTQISNANRDLLGFPVPAYHTGLKVDYTFGNHRVGGAVVDSLYGTSQSTIFSGDGDFTDKGLEAYYTYKGIKDTQVWVGAGQDNDGGGAVYDVWVSHALSSTDTVAAEYLVDESDGYNWLLVYVKAIDSKLSLTSRLSGETSNTTDTKYVKYTLAPSYAFTPKLTVRAEISFLDYSGSGATASSSTFYAVQSLYRF